MTSMDQIQIITEQARAAGMSYGHYVALNPDILPPPQEMSDWRKCKTCPEFFLPPLTKSGERSRFTSCPACREKLRVQRAEDKARRESKRKTLYITACTVCGAEVQTWQAPRRGCNIYCQPCRANKKYSKKEGK